MKYSKGPLSDKTKFYGNLRKVIERNFYVENIASSRENFPKLKKKLKM